jgi:hypothetical protein
MVSYDIFFTCKECCGEHPLGVKIQIPDGPKQRTSIGAFYADKKIPEQIKRLTDHHFECPKSKNSLFHDDVYQLFLVPLSRSIQ